GDYTTGNLWFTTGAGSIVGGGTYYYRFNPTTDDPATIEPFFSLAGLKGVNGFGEEVEQMNYGTSVFDPRNNRLIVMTGRKGAASGQYRDHWVHFVDGATAEITRTFKLSPYYWFQSLPILPDKYDAVIGLEDMTLLLADGDKEIDLSGLVSDMDNIDANIRLSLLDTPTAAAGNDETSGPVAEVSLEGKTLTISPKALGEHSFTLAAQSNGRTVSRTINVKVDITTGIDSPADYKGSVKCDGKRIYVNGFAGHSFRIYNVTGQQVAAFDVDSDDYIFDFGTHNGVYILHSDTNFSSKVIIR
ncbi:MAG: T9SS type A sorting domain-containing protein, partial [Duncaniella sp.]|nr:T9SS type A sorting domain-containing protein [Duncaniella sp.]